MYGDLVLLWIDGDWLTASFLVLIEVVVMPRRVGDCDRRGAPDLTGSSSALGYPLLSAITCGPSVVGCTLSVSSTPSVGAGLRMGMPHLLTGCIHLCSDGHCELRPYEELAMKVSVKLLLI